MIPEGLSTGPGGWGDRGSAEAAPLTVGYVPGAWDMFHIGHLNILLRAREQCDRLVVGVVTDEALQQAKGKLPVIPLDERVEVIRHLAMVDDVVVDFSSSKLEVWERVRFDVLFKGDDWRGHPEGREARGRHGLRGRTGHLLPLHRAHLEHAAALAADPALTAAGHRRPAARRTSDSASVVCVRRSSRSSASAYSRTRRTSMTTPAQPGGPHAVVVGLGYVGLPLAQQALRSGVSVVGLDRSLPVVEGLTAGRSHVDDLGPTDVAEMLAAGFRATTDPRVVADAEVVVICVPTPLSEEGGPDLSAVRGAAESIAPHLAANALVVLESTTYPGTTEEFVQPILEAGSGRRVGIDLSLAFSPSGSTRATRPSASPTPRRWSAA